MRLPRIYCTAGFCFITALAVLVLPWSVIASFLFASGFHEACHLLMLMWCKVDISQIQFGMFGAKITAGSLTTGQELICAAAGPVGSLLLAFLARWMPHVAFFGLCQGLSNLMPIYPLDGGRMVRAIFTLAKMGLSGYNSSDY